MKYVVRCYDAATVAQPLIESGAILRLTNLNNPVEYKTIPCRLVSGERWRETLSEVYEHD